MSDTFNHEADAWDSLNDEDDVVEYMARQGWNGPRSKSRGSSPRCKHCGSVNVFWLSVRGEHRLYSTLTSERHVCPIHTDAFDVIPEE